MRRDDFNLPDPPPDDRPGDRWACGIDGGGPCSRGPGPNGRCPLAEACHPRRTWHGRRKQLSLISCCAVVLVVFLAAFGKHQAEVFKPGELSTPHAQILAGTLASQRCAACHPQAAESAWQWFSSASGEHAGVTQSDRCLDCHHGTMDRATAKLAHNLPRRTREAIRLTSASRQRSAPTTVTASWNQSLPGPAVDQDNVACGVCHREHHGAVDDLLDVSDTQCQSCHSQRFGGFADSHPDWGGWPYRRGGEIAFDHATHANKHFPATIRDGAAELFQCATCHPRGSDGELQRSTGFDQACARCHTESLHVETLEGVELMTLPSLAPESADRIGNWPPQATGFYDGKVSPLADLLLRGDEATARAMLQIPNQDFSKITGGDHILASAAETIAASHHRLLGNMAAGGQQVLLDSPPSSVIKPETMRALVRTISPQLIQQASERWFPTNRISGSNPGADLTTTAVDRESHSPDATRSDRLIDDAQEDDLLGGDLIGNDRLDLLQEASDPLDFDPLVTRSLDLDPLLGDPLLGDPLGESSPSLERKPDVPSPSDGRFDPDRLMPVGGWYVDDLRASIRYRGCGHDDPVLKSVIELVSQLPPSDRTRTQLMQTRAVRGCVQCHPGAVADRPTWVNRPLIGRRDQLTKFSHRSHLNVAQLADCQHCHRIASDSPDTVQLVGHGESRPEFVPLSKQACVACHVPKAAGDACTTCHRYHVFEFTSFDSIRLEP